MMMMMRAALLLLALTGTCGAILPEIVNNGVNHILEDNSAYGQTEPGRTFVEVEQLQEDPQPKPEDAFHQKNDSVGASTLPPTHHSDATSDKVIDSEFAHSSADLGCVTNGGCGKGRYCLYDVDKPKCMPCKTTDMTCTFNQECCDEQLCVWGQCSPNATKGGPGTTCESESDCSSELCCALHKALLVAVCLAKPIERERCFDTSNHLMELLSWNAQNKGPRKHCPCAGDTHCRQLGRGSLCLKGKDSSEEELTDTLYSEIDYII
ncbi:hypothetical protein Q5P01_006684 [Channa striata]|uniref:Dickkopf N-terminal cysteine-rich domain-containing protein n=1 Tax=Channa striata TaxID=64152 RepID=A0AA88NDJ7_CHASR|nr:hypothetical protein Q5P01_006684 [Channa striata]